MALSIFLGVLILWASSVRVAVGVAAAISLIVVLLGIGLS